MSAWWIPIVPGAAWFVGLAVFSDGGLVSQVRKRLVKPTPVVALVCDMMVIDRGWTYDYRDMRHETGVVVEHGFSDPRSLTVDGLSVPLTPADKHRLRVAYRASVKRRKKVEEEQAAMVLAERAQAFAHKAASFAENVVQMRKRP